MQRITPKYLLQTARAMQSATTVPLEPYRPWHLFKPGARWMAHCLAAMRKQPLHFPEARPYEWYGWMKYGLAAGLSMAFLAACHALGSWWCAPMVVLIFYGFEVQFVFLFPLLVDGESNPARESMRLVWKSGLFRAIFTVLPLAAYMMGGGFLGKGFENSWLVGCRAVLIWYENTKNSK